MGNKLFSITGLIAAVGLFIAVNAFSGAALKRSRIDLTERNLYSLSDGTRNIIQGLEEAVDLKFFYTPEQAPDGSPYPPYAQRVRELLEEYESLSDGKIRLELVDPKPFAEEEDLAGQGGINGFPVNQVGDKFYFGLAATNSVDEREGIPFFDPSREASLEYDITQIIYRLGTSDRPVVGLLSTLPMSGGAADPRTGRGGQPWFIYTMLSQAVEMRAVEPTVTTIDPEIDVLMLVHPKDLGDEALYAVDQFVLGGGRIMAFVDPYCLFDPTAQGDPRSGIPGNHASNLDKLLTAWGVQLIPNKVVGDKNKAQNVNSASGPLACPVVMALDQECMDENDVAIRELSSLSFLLAGAFESIEGASTTLTPLVQTTVDGGGTLDSVHLQMGQPDLERITKAFVEDQTRRAIAVRLTGSVKSAFPDGRPKIEPAEGEETPAPAEFLAVEHIAESKEDIQAVLVADADFLENQMWTTEGFFRQITQGNGSFVTNLVENLCGSSDLISLRSREGFQRPFTKKAELEQAAGERLKTKQEEIETALKATELRLAELQGPQESAGTALLSPEQELELERANRNYLEQRKELREVRSQLNADIKSLGTRLKLFNTALIPLILLILALFSARNHVRSRGTQ